MILSTIVTLPYDPTWKALEWAKKNCPDYITNKVNSKRFGIGYSVDGDYLIDYVFSSTESATLFALKWK